MSIKIRTNVIEHIKLLGSPSEQLVYEENVQIADVQSELICGYFYEPKNVEFVNSFTSNELKDLAHLYGLLCESSSLRVSTVTDLLKQAEWRSVISLANKIYERMK